MTLKILCLSNGHGEDAIAVQILQELQKYPLPPSLAALPIVGEGYAYTKIPRLSIIGPLRARANRCLRCHAPRNWQH
ncbi:MAG: hypothetical protein F6K34_10400, partial [Okeania sp. SIO4D6]|nr:hypothetical protein [Okeania sp. SIO4D6]